MEENITRAEALKKLGKYAAFTALGTVIMLTPKQAQAQSPPGNSGNNPWGGPPGWPGNGNGNGNGHGNGGWKARRSNRGIFNRK